MQGYLLRDGIIVIQKGKGIHLCDLFEGKKLFISSINKDELYELLVNIDNANKYQKVIITTLLEKKYIEKNSDKVACIEYEKEFLL